MPKTPRQRSAFKRHMSREARLARNLALANRLQPESKDELRAQAAQACSTHPVKRIEPSAQPDGLAE